MQVSLFYQLLGNTPEAMEAYTGIINRNVADESSLAVAINMDKNFGFFGRYFAEISFFGEPREEKCTEISFV